MQSTEQAASAIFQHHPPVPGLRHHRSEAPYHAQHLLNARLDARSVQRKGNITSSPSRQAPDRAIGRRPTHSQIVIARREASAPARPCGRPGGCRPRRKLELEGFLLLVVGQSHRPPAVLRLAGEAEAHRSTARARRLAGVGLVHFVAGQARRPPARLAALSRLRAPRHHLGA
eukprot:scaffold263_cov120-Isochrysis_galbana.AAC.25